MENTKVSFPLLLAKDNDAVCITEIKGGQNFKEKCISQGLIPGQELKVLNNSGSGPCLVSLFDSRLAIGSGMLSRIFVVKE